MSGAVEEASSAEARLQAALAPAGSPVEIAAALEAVGQHNPSRRRRLQAEILRQAFRQAAQLAKACGWNGRVVLAGDDILLDQDQVLLPAEPSHFRGSGPPAIDALARPLETFGIDARIIVDLDAGSGEDALRLARRFPQARVFAGAASAERADAIEAMLALQHTPIPNLELVWPLPRGGGDGKLLAALAREFGFRRFDLLKFDARTWGAGLAPEIAALAGRIACACVEVSAEVAPGDRDELLAAFEAAGMVLLEKRSVPTADARAWLEAHIAERPLVTAWFVEKRLTGSRPSPEVAGLKLSKGAAPSPARPLRARLYEWLGRLNQRLDPTDKRFEFERLYVERPDPWLYLSNPYETRKYRHTLEVAAALRPQAASVLEIGCSNGVFTRMLARVFGDLVATDIAGEALKLARRSVGPHPGARYVRSDIRRLDLGRRFDLIFSAELLYYLPDEATSAVADVFRRHLTPGGMVVTVMPLPAEGMSNNPTPRWRRRLQEHGFRLESETVFEDSLRPCEILAYVVPGEEPAGTAAGHDGRS